MPVNEKQTQGEILYQRDLYKAGGITQWYWDYKDNKILSKIPKDTKKIVDFGCGEGILLEKIEKYFPSTYTLGIDVIPENIKICEENGLNVLLTEVGKPTPISSGSIDVVLLIEVIEHLEDPITVLNEVYRILKSGGILIILFPNDRAFAIYRLALLKIKELKYDPGHVCQYTFSKIEKLIEPDFKIIEKCAIPFGMFSISVHGLMVCRKE